MYSLQGFLVHIYLSKPPLKHIQDEEDFHGYDGADLTLYPHKSITNYLQKTFNITYMNTTYHIIYTGAQYMRVSVKTKYFETNEHWQISATIKYLITTTPYSTVIITMLQHKEQVI